MIRKISAIILCSLMIMSIARAEQTTLITAIVDDFTIRNGIKFLMTMDEVKAKETLKPAEGLYSQYDHSIKIRGSMAGFDDANGEYIFNDDLQLESFAYCLGGSMLEPKSVEQIRKDYYYTETALIDKYGDALTDASGYYSEYIINYADIIKNAVDSGILNLSERFIKMSSGGYVKIEHWIGYSSLDTCLFTDHYVQYTYYPDEMMNLIIADYEKKQKQKDTDY